MKPLRFFYLPNENARGDQIGPHKAFRLLHEAGELSALQSYSYLVERRRFGSQREALEDLVSAIEAFRPDIVYWQHLNRSYPVDAALLQRVKAVASRPKFVWHDPDPYGRWIKPIDAVMRTALRAADAAVVKGLGYFADEIRRIGCPRVLFAPESYDDERFGTPWTPTPQRRLDAVMVANLTCLKRIPFLFMPGGRSRLRLARLLHRAYRDRFAVFGTGQGWAGEPYCRGPVAFNEQERTCRSSWLTVNWSQFDTIPMYFSDRLPISLAAGVPHVTNYQRGFEHVLPDARGVYFAHTPEEALDIADMLLSLPRERLLEIGTEAAAYARERLNATRVYADIVTSLREQLFETA